MVCPTVLCSFHNRSITEFLLFSKQLDVFKSLFFSNIQYKLVDG